MKYALIFLLMSIWAVNEVNADNRIEELVVTGVYSAQDDTPITFQNIQKDQISGKNFGQEPSFILSETPSIIVYSDSGSYQGYSYFRLRGIDQSRINMTLNGAPLNEPEDQGVYFSNFPDFFGSIESIQIQRGVGVTQNGTASFGGSIQFQSRSLRERDQGELGASVGSFGTTRVMAEYLSGDDNQNAYYLRVSKLDSDGYKHRSANKSQSVFMGAEFIGQNSLLRVTGFVGEQENELAWLGVAEEIIEQDPRTNANSEEDDEFKQSLVILNFDQIISSEVDIRSGLYISALHGNYDFDLNNFLGFESTQEMFNYALDSNFYGGFSNIHYELGEVRAVIGFHVNQYSRDHVGTERSLGRLYKNTGNKDSYSVYTKFHYTLGNATLFADIESRHTDFDYDGTTELETFDWSFVNTKVGIDYQLSDAARLYYSVGRVSREPTRTDLFGGNDNLEVDDNGDPLIFITRPERVIDHEMGLRATNGVFSGNINLFYMDFEDEIVLNGQFGPNGLALNQGVETSVRKGVEISASLDLGQNWQYSVNTSINDNVIEHQDVTFEPVLSPDLILNQSIEYHGAKFSLGFTHRYQSSAYLDFANMQNLDAFSVFDSYIGYKTEGWSVMFHVNNIADKEYYSNGLVDFDGRTKYFIAPPRNAYATIRVPF